MRRFFSRLWVTSVLIVMGLPPSLARASSDSSSDDPITYIFSMSMDLSNPEQPLTPIGEMSLPVQ
ncbi:MAG: hypothetical protein GXY33_17175 [Phycisphaerae bacterium]|nr:hypothetical protein [Phycisphaerae bacterium]